MILPGDLSWLERKKWRCVSFSARRDEMYATSPLFPKDAALIVAAVNALPALLDVADAARTASNTTSDRSPAANGTDPFLRSPRRTRWGAVMSDQPTTAAGRALLKAIRSEVPWFVSGSEPKEIGMVSAIEAEAVAAYRADLAAKVRGSRFGSSRRPRSTAIGTVTTSRAAVLALIRRRAPMSDTLTKVSTASTTFTVAAGRPAETRRLRTYYVRRMLRPRSALGSGRSGPTPTRA